MDKRLLITSTDLMMVQFLLPHVISLSQQGYIVDVACSEVGGRFTEVSDRLKGHAGNIFRLSLRRSPASLSNLRGYRELVRVIDRGHYDLIWTNEPVMGVVTRLAARKARKRGTLLLYMAHGFHFYRGAPLINWLVYYPVERLMSRHTDVICTVNTEDYARAGRFHTGEVRYIHGIGIDTGRLTPGSESLDIRKELGLDKDSFIVLSVGELNRNKNQSTVIRAIAQLDNPGIHYVLCGKGYNESRLKDLATKLGVRSRVHFLGYRRDVVDICSQSDVYAMPSFREGLPVSSLEAMYCGLPLVTSEIRGLTDVNKDGRNGFLCRPEDYRGFAGRISELYTDRTLRREMGDRNKEEVRPYTIENTLHEVSELISGTLNG